METIDTATLLLSGSVILIFLFHQQYLFGKMIKQNSRFIYDADQRLKKANEMVIVLAHSADTLSSSVSEMKDMMIHLEKIYTERNNMLVKNRDEFKEAYEKLLHTYMSLQHKYEEMMSDSYNTLKEIARRPTFANNNNTDM